MSRDVLRRVLCAALLGSVAGLTSAWALMWESPGRPPLHGFPRLIAMQIGEPDYHIPSYQQDMARFNVVILGFYPGWERSRSAEPIRDTVAEIKARNPGSLIGQYTVMNESRDERHKWAATELDRINKLNEMNWWLRSARGHKVQWTSRYGNWDINFTHWAKRDAEGRRYPEWIANRDYLTFFKAVPDFAIWYVDNVMKKPRVRGDWDMDGVDDSPDDPRVQQAFRAGYSALWDEIRRLHPNALIMANTNSDLSEDEYRGKVEAAFLEALMGKEWSIERRLGWSEMMRHYRSVRTNLRHPAIVGFNVWGDRRDLRFFRYAFGSCLMDDGFFSFTDLAVGYSSAVWFDEYNLKLGTAQTRPPATAWKNGVWRRDFENGIVLVNPTAAAATVILEKPFKRLVGQQDNITNNGAIVSTLSLPSKDGILLQRVP